MDRKFIIFVVLASVAQSGTSIEFDNEFNAISNVFIEHSFLNQSTVAADLYIANNAVISASKRIESAQGAIFGEIEDFLTKLSVLIEGESRDDFIVSATARDKPVADFIVVAELVYNVISATQPGSCSAIVTAREAYIINGPAIVDDYYNAINLTLDQDASCSTILANIISVRDTEAIPRIATVAESFFDLIRNNRTLDAELDAMLTSLQEKASTSLVDSTIFTFDGIKILAKAFCENNGVPDRYFQALRTYLGKSIAVTVDYVEYLATGILLGATSYTTYS